MMNFTISVRLLILFLPLVLSIGGCASTSALDFHDERLGKAITDTTAKLERSPNDAELYVARGRAYYCKRQYEEAFSDFNRAVEIDPENAAAYRGRGNASRAVDRLRGSPQAHPHKGVVADTNKANILEPGELDKEINRGFGYISNVTNELIYPVTGVCITGIDLILGSTTKTQAVKILPPPPWNYAYADGPIPVYRPTKPRIGKVGKVVDSARYNYKTQIEQYFPLKHWRDLLLVFDKNNKLIVIRTYDTIFLTGLRSFSLDEIGNERLKQIAHKRYEKYQDLMRQHQFTEVYRDSEHATYGYKYSDKTMRAEITPCVTVDITVPIEPSSKSVLYTLEYIYTCPTKTNQ